MEKGKNVYGDFIEITTEEMENTKPCDIRDILADHFKEKQEVAKIFEEIREEIMLALNSNYKAHEEHKQKYGTDSNSAFLSYVSGKVHALQGIDDFLAEIEKKYIGE